MSNEPRFRYPDTSFPVSKGNMPDGNGDIELYFGKSKLPSMSARDNMPLDALTLQQAYGGNNTFLTNIMHYNFVGIGGWWTDLCPIQRVEGLNQEWSIYNFPRQAMEPAPEETTPRVVKFQKSDHAESLTRFSIGGKAYHDFYKTPEGRAAIEAQMGQMVSGGWITAKLLVAGAVFNAKLYWEEYKRNYGPSYTKIMDVLQDEINYFGALSKDEKGIYKLHDYAIQVTKEASPPWDMIILGKGALSFVAFSGSYETESYRRGENVVQNRLSLGARSVTGIFPGVTIYEDEPFALNNVGPDEIQQFQRNAIVGRFFMVDGSSFGKYQEEYLSERELSTKAVSMSIDDWHLWKINYLIDNDMRWKDDGSLSDMVGALAANVPSAVQRAGVELHDPRLVDPYIWQADDGSYHPIAHWGDMDKAYLSHEQTVLHGEMAAKNITRRLSEKQREAFRELKDLKNRLLEVPDILDESYQGYMFAITANPENRTGAADFGTHNSYMLKANKFGFSQPPYVDKTPKRSNNLGGAEVDLQNGALYVKGSGDRRLYIWVLYPEHLEGATSVVNGNEPLTFTPGSNTDRTGGYAIPPEPRVTFNSFTPFSQEGTPYAFIAAPIDAFGPLDARGAAPWFDLYISDDSEWHSVAYRRLEGPAPAATDDVVGGIRAPRLVRAPPAPIGFGVPAGLDTLAQLHAEGDCRGWNATDCKIAYDGVQVKNTIGNILVKEFYPECVLAQDKYVPFYMRSSTDREKNKINSVFANLWDEARDPVWARIPQLTPRGLTTSGEQYTILITDLRAGAATPRGIDAAGLGFLVRRAGFEVTGAGQLSLKTSTRLGDVPVDRSEDVQALFMAIINSPHVDPNILNMLKDYQDGGQAGKLFASYASSNQSGLGQAYATHLANMHGIRNASHDFAWFMAKELLAIRNRSGLSAAVKVFNTVLGIAAASLHGAGHNRYTAESLNQVVLNAESLGKRNPNVNNRDDEGNDAAEALAKANRDVEASAVSPFINTRLAISPDGFHNLYALLEGSDRTDIKVVQAANSVVRPSDPRNGGKPAGAYTSEDLDPEKVKNAMNSFRYARANQPRGLAQTSLAREALLGPDEGDLSNLGLRPYSRKRKNLSDAVLDDAVGPLYDNINERVWLVRRYEAVSSSLAENDVARMAALMFSLTNVSKQSLLTLIKNKLPIPDCTYIIAQPWIRIRTSAGVWAIKGAQTGSIAYNYEDVVLQFNGMNKTWHMHYTIWLNAAIYDESRILILKDIKFEGYIGGMDETVNGMNELKDWDPTSLDMARVKSSFVFSCGARFTRENAQLLSNPLSLFGRYDPRALPVNFAARNTTFNPNAPLYPSFLYYNSIWGFTEMNTNAIIGPNTYQGCKESTYITGLMPMANHLVYEHRTGDWTKRIRGTGHLDCLEPPMREVLSGKIQIKCDKN